VIFNCRTTRAVCAVKVSLPQKDCHELLRQERLLEIRERQSDYLWASQSAGGGPGECLLPGQIRAQAVKELPVNEQLEAEKYAGMPWDIDPTTIETLLPFLAGTYHKAQTPSVRFAVDLLRIRNKSNQWSRAKRLSCVYTLLFLSHFQRFFCERFFIIKTIVEYVARNLGYLTSFTTLLNHAFEIDGQCSMVNF